VIFICIFLERCNYAPGLASTIGILPLPGDTAWVWASVGAGAGDAAVGAAAGAEAAVVSAAAEVGTAAAVVSVICADPGAEVEPGPEVVVELPEELPGAEVIPEPEPPDIVESGAASLSVSAMVCKADSSAALEDSASAAACDSAARIASASAASFALV
jgi:hypothetical protein